MELEHDGTLQEWAKDQFVLAAKQALIDELVDGLEPFGEVDDWPDKMDCEDIPADATDIKIEDLRRARSLIACARSSGKAGSDA